MRKVVVYVPAHSVDETYSAIDSVAGERIGNLAFRTLSADRYLGAPQAMDEARIEFVCDGDTCKIVIDAIKRVHPYDDATVDVWPLDFA